MPRHRSSARKARPSPRRRVSRGTAQTTAEATRGVDADVLRSTKDTAAAAEQSASSHNGNHPLSAGGGQWWNGERWIPTRTADGLWMWDGTRWNPPIDFRAKRLAEL